MHVPKFRDVFERNVAHLLMRHCRSTSINARVLASTIPIPTSAPNPGACVEALAAFPKHATLRFLRLLGQGAGLVDSSLLTSLHALQLDQPLGEEGAEALRRSQTVEKVSLKVGVRAGYRSAHGSA